MKPAFSWIFSALLAAMAVAIGAGLLAQWQQTVELRAELDELRLETAALARLRAENQRWKDTQIPTAELEALRADHAALPRLRAEIEALKRGATAIPPSVPRTP